MKAQQYAYVVLIDEKIIGIFAKTDTPPPVEVMKDILENHFGEDVAVAEDWITEPQSNEIALAFQLQGYKPEVVTLLKTLLLP